MSVIAVVLPLPDADNIRQTENGETTCVIC
jgi:hypothetical protein